MTNVPQMLVDKIALLQDFVWQRRACFNRPTGFGKSSLIAMLEELFTHGTERCADLAIAAHWQEKRYLVIALSLTGLSDPDTIESEVIARLAAAFSKAGFAGAQQVGARFATLNESLGSFDALRKKQPIVVLIDDWDYPVTANWGQPDAFAACQEVLNTLFAWTRELRSLHYLLLTGTCAFCQNELGAGQDLRDLSMDARFAALLGYTEAEIKQYFASELKAAAARLQLSESELMTELERHYGGYSFDGVTQLFCPAAINQFMACPELSWDAHIMQAARARIAPFLSKWRLKPNYWEQATAGTLEVMRYQLLSCCDYREIRLTPLLVQLGLLTFKQDLDPGDDCDLLHGYACGFTNEAAAHCCEQMLR